MMDCAEYRRALLADPHDQHPDLVRHLQSCGECPAYTERLLRFEGRLQRALRVSPSAGVVLPFRLRRQRAAARGWLAIAASVLVGFGIAGGLWLAAPHTSLAADVVAHMAHEPQAWVSGEVPVAAPELAAVLRNTGMRLRPAAGLVSYAQSCPFRGHRVPHLVVQTDMGPVTVMVLVHESVAKPAAFDEQGYRGLILPVPEHGSLAVLAKDQSGDLAAVEKIAARVRAAIEWTG